MYTEEQRRVFGPFWDGSCNVYRDPIRVHRRLVHALGGEPNEWLSKFHTGDYDAVEKVIQAAGWALEMIPFDYVTGDGATEAEVEDALRSYLGWLEGKDLPVAISPTSSRPTALESSEVESWTTEPMSVSG